MDLFGHNTHGRRLPFDFPQKEGYRAVWDETRNGFFLTIPDGELFYAPDFFNIKVSDRFVEYFLENNSNDWKTADWRHFDKEELDKVRFKNILWHHDKINIYGRQVFLPRYSAWYGDGDKHYTYSGLTLQPKPWNEGLLFIKNQVDKISGVCFNSVLMNWYRDGEDHMGWHTDAEKALGKNPVIGSVNFGATRRFLFRRIADNREKVELPLKHGTFLLMGGQIQHFWQHAVPKEKKVKEARFNLTFRVINH